ncbi:thyroid receptor-interacting protein 6 isoform X2 [Alligator sinensis]|uniref:Thyroid receptor-interacting protein 6 isoform X2 n=1 Tax=Alligator sinensis TaxID=38654 RepID=A0A1U7S9R9_ALLSI|nr:thyroid receptor-interacting protein 6 isoform X2 [Alligator sinensis]
MAAERAGLQGQPDKGMWVGSEGRQWSGDLPPTTSAAHTPWGPPVMSGPTWLPPKLAGGSPQPPRTVPTGPLETNGTPAPEGPNPRYPEVPRAGRIGYTMQGSTPDRGASIDSQIDSLTTMLADLESAAPSHWGGARQNYDLSAYRPSNAKMSGSLTIGEVPPAYGAGAPRRYPQPTPASYATALTPLSPAFNVQVKVAQPVPGYSRPQHRADAPPLASRGQETPRGWSPGPRAPYLCKEDCAGPIKAPLGGGGSYQQQVPLPCPEDELDRLTKKLVQDMQNPPPGEYFGRCGTCGGAVQGAGAGVAALGRLFHATCFVCVSCRRPLRGLLFYALDRRPHCEACYAPILDRILRAMGKAFHPRCFTCVVCRRGLDGVAFTVDATSQVHCLADFHRKFAPRCSVCGDPIMPEPGQEETVRIVALDRSFHIGCYKCEECGLLLSSEGEGRGCYPLDGHILCKTCSARRIQELSATVTTDC